MEPSTVRYLEAFEAVWAGTGRRGGKHAAYVAWKKVGSPGWEVIGSVWAAYLLSERPQAGFTKDLSGWLNGRFHTQEWEPAAPRARAPAATPATGYAAITADKNWHAGQDKFAKG